MKTRVVNVETGLAPTQNELVGCVKNEPWANGLCECDTLEFAVTISGELLLVDQCGNYRSCLPNRFTFEYIPVGE